MLENLYTGLFGTAFFGIGLTLLACKIGLMINQKTKMVIFNPLLIAIIIVIAFLAATGISYDTYKVGGSMIQFLLTPATIALAVPLYRQLVVLKKNFKAIICAISFWSDSNRIISCLYNWTNHGQTVFSNIRKQILK